VLGTPLLVSHWPSATLDKRTDAIGTSTSVRSWPSATQI